MKRQKTKQAQRTPSVRIDDLEASSSAVMGGFTPVPIPEGAPKSILSSVQKVGFTPVPIPGEQLVAAALAASTHVK